MQRKLSEFTENDPTIDSISTPNRSQAPSSHLTSGHGGTASPYQFTGFDSNIETKQYNRKNISSGSSVASMGSEFAQRAKSLVHLMNCHSGERDREFSPANAADGGLRYLSRGR